MSGPSWWLWMLRDKLARRRALEAEARLAEEQRLDGLSHALGGCLLRPAIAASPDAHAPEIPRTVSPETRARPGDFAAMARVEGWAPR